MTSKAFAIVHCAATPPRADLGAEQIAAWHAKMFPHWAADTKKRLGKYVTGYNRVITTAGEVQKWPAFPVCPDDVHAAHTGDCSVAGTGLADLNSRGVGICLVGGVDAHGRPENNFTPAQWQALEGELVRVWDDNPAIKRDAGTWGHRDMIKKAQALGSTRAHAKACPCFSVQAWLAGPDFVPDPAKTAAALAKREGEGRRLGFLEGLVAPTLEALGAPMADVVATLRGLGLPIPDLAPATHIVAKGDTLWSISARYGVPVAELVARNGIKDPDDVPVGTVLKIYR